MDLVNKNIAVLGLGIEGSDVVRFLQKYGAKEITVFDRKPAKELKETTEKFKSLKGLKFKFGRDYLQDGLSNFDIIFRSPAFKLSMPEIVEAGNAGVEITSATKLFFDLCPGKIIGVTGTKGKGTTATLIYRILKQAGKKVFLAGNIGVPMLTILPKIDSGSWVVLELSSFQLQDLDKSPHIAVVLFIASEHLDYHSSTEEYIVAKENIVLHQGAGDFAVLNSDNENSFVFGSITEANVRFFSRRKKVNGAYVLSKKIYLFDDLLGATAGLKLIGSHNLDNVCAASLAAYLAGADLPSIKKAVFSFTGLEHRLEPVRELNGIRFYNDSFSTTPETTIAAIKSFKRPIILIAGGSDKGSEYTQLGQELSKSTVRILVLIGRMAEKIKKAALTSGFKGEIIFQPKTMKEVVKIAFEKGNPGDVVLLSPACASFGMFKNYKDRGLQFKKYALSL
jgi:UDP-N-acetylmuramoylalanine--D-glutamate ligase